MGKQALKYSSNCLWKSDNDAWQELSKQTKLQSVVFNKIIQFNHVIIVHISFNNN